MRMYYSLADLPKILKLSGYFLNLGNTQMHLSRVYLPDESDMHHLHKGVHRYRLQTILIPLLLFYGPRESFSSF